MSLSLYHKKRNFDKTPEPGALKGKKRAKLTFVVQRHNASHLHYDFRLEMDGVLKSWAIPKGPSMVAGIKHLAVWVEDHPLPYGKFYGEIPKGNYGAGTVEIWDSGTYKPMEETDDPEQTLLEMLEKGDLKFILDGTYLKGAFALVKMHDGKEKNWLLIKKKDEFALPDFNIETFPPLVSPLKKKEIADKKSSSDQTAQNQLSNLKKTDLQKIQPMLAKQSSKVIDRGDWIYEIKYDGYRIIAKVENGRVELTSRNGNSFTSLYASLANELKKVDDTVILDGEVVIENEAGASNFQLLQNFNTTRKGVLKFYVFDLLYLNGEWIDRFPLNSRKELLTTFFQKYTFDHILLTPYQTGNGKAFFETCAEKGGEGMIAKNPSSTYQIGKRSENWLKVKTHLSTEAIICGYTFPQNSWKHFGSLILGIYENGTLKYIGNCGTGFTEASLKELSSLFKKLETENCPFESLPKMTSTKGKPVWLQPELVCNVKFSGWTKEKRMRDPVFMGLRVDKSIDEVMDDTVNTIDEMDKKTQSFPEKEKIITLSGHEVKCTNLTKVYWPEEGYTKGDLIAYYQMMSKYILPYLKDRPQSLNRFPNGITGPSFYQKDMDVAQLPPWVKTEKLFSKSNNADIDYLICNDVASLVYMTNLGCIEINPWHSTYQEPENPSYMILDLDPGDISFENVVDTALVIKEICDEIKIPCYCKTSGATGLHIYIPLGGKYTYDEVKTFGELMAVLTHKRLPEITSIERSVAKRKDKIYVDFLQNRKGQTIAAAYCVRPRAGATVSAPLLWEEVNHDLSPKLFTMFNMEKRLLKVGDLWKPVLKKGIELDQVLKRIDKIG